MYSKSSIDVLITSIEVISNIVCCMYSKKFDIRAHHVYRTYFKSAVGPLCFKHAGVHAPPLIKALYIGKSKKIQGNLKVNYIQNENEDIAGM